MKNKGHASKTSQCRPTSVLDFAHALANHRPELQLGENDSKSGAHQMVSHQMSEPFKTLPCSSDFHDTLFRGPLVFILIALPIRLNLITRM